MHTNNNSIIAESPVMKALFLDIVKIAKSNASVFLTGESGTGKEVIANAIHQLSPRASASFIRVNCAAIPETLLESEFFGHEKGSFTGAMQRRFGRFEMANNGTLLLDEISEIPLVLQPKLLRVIQEQEFERVGGTHPIRVDVRLIATSNRNMQTAIEKNLFREDLFFRLHVIPLKIPPLRQRKEDILPLAELFLQRLCIENQQELKSLSIQAKELLVAYPWPGNIRELANVIERTVVLHTGKTIKAEDLKIPMSCSLASPPTFGANPGSLHTLEAVEQAHILATLKTYGNNKTKAAKSLGISLRTLRNKVNGYQSQT